MGLSDLRDIVVRREVSFEELRGKLAVDAFNTLYQFLSIIRSKDGSLLADSRGRPTSHLSGLFYRTCNFLEKGVQPIYVFDGEPSPLKKKTIAERGERKAQAEELMRKAIEEGRTEEARSLAQRTARLTQEMIDESKALLELMGVPAVQAPGEGEAQCAWMAEEKLVNAAASQDFDALLFGAPRLVRNLAVAGKRKLPYKQTFVEVLPEEILLKESLEALGITREKLVWIALLCGTDFNEGVHGIGPKKALKLVKENDSFEAILEKIGAEMDWKPVEKIFLKPEFKQVDAGELEFAEPKRAELISFMLERDFSRERVENALARAFREPFGTQQAGLKKWF